MADNHCGSEIAQRFGWTAPAYRKKEGATPHSGARKHSLQYDGSLMGGIWLGLEHGM